MPLLMCNFFCFLYTMVPALRYRMWLVWAIYSAAQFLFVCMSTMAAAEISIHYHPEPGISTLSQARRGAINSNLVFQVQQSEIPTEIMQERHGSTIWKKNFLCRTLGRCLLAQESASSSPPYDSPGVPAADMDNSPMTLPTLPTDPESPPPAARRTNPSTLVTPNSHPSGSSTPGAGAAMLSKGSNMASKVSISAGVGVSGVLLLVLALLYYFKPDMFMCCKTCVRVQVFHHAHPTKK